jgi:hypothetical protein
MDQVWPHSAWWNLLSDDAILIDTLQPVESYVNQLTSCEAILSSSLHGLIIAGAYGIPAARISFGEDIGGDGTKFVDYFESVQMPSQPVVRVTREMFSDLRALEEIETACPKADVVAALQRGLRSAFCWWGEEAIA